MSLAAFLCSFIELTASYIFLFSLFHSAKPSAAQVKHIIKAAPQNSTPR